MYVQFSEDKKEIVSVFGSPQDPETHPSQGEVAEDDPRYIEFIEKMKAIE